MRYTFEILAMALLIAAGSVLRPAAPAPGCSAPPAAHARAASTPHQEGGRG